MLYCIVFDLYCISYVLYCIYIYACIGANYDNNNRVTWNKAILGSFLLLTMIPARSQWGRYNLPRCIYKVYQVVLYCIWFVLYCIQYIYIHIYEYIYICILYAYFFLFNLSTALGPCAVQALPWPSDCASAVRPHLVAYGPGDCSKRIHWWINSELKNGWKWPIYRW